MHGPTYGGYTGHGRRLVSVSPGICGPTKGGFHMSDLIYIGIAALFFWLTWGLVAFCERLERSSQ